MVYNGIICKVIIEIHQIHQMYKLNTKFIDITPLFLIIMLMKNTIQHYKTLITNQSIHSEETMV